MNDEILEGLPNDTETTEEPADPIENPEEGSETEEPSENPDSGDEPIEPTIPDEPEIPVTDSVLLSIKKLLGIMPEDEHFDADVMIHINSVFMILNQLGVGPDKCYCISGKENLWQEFIGDSLDLESVKTYIYYKVKLLFDPPTSTALISSMERVINEMEWRLNFSAEQKLNQKTETETETADEENNEEENYDDNSI